LLGDRGGIGSDLTVMLLDRNGRKPGFFRGPGGREKGEDVAASERKAATTIARARHRKPGRDFGESDEVIGIFKIIKKLCRRARASIEAVALSGAQRTATCRCGRS